jgi:uncharacterized protein YutE (UPF0331/DUF86 family)
VHVYVDLDLQQVAASVPDALAGYRTYVREVARSVRDAAETGNASSS